MLHDFLSESRSELIARCRIKVAQRTAPAVTDVELDHGIPIFLDQLIKTLQVEQSPTPMLSRKVSGPSGGGRPFLSEISAAAAQHGRELLVHGFTIDQVVHDYGDLCQAITELAFEKQVPIEVDEFQTLNRCLDNGIADAVTEFAYQRDFLIADNQAHALNERLGFLSHELRNLIQTATLAIAAIRIGQMGLHGATGAVLDRSLSGIRDLVDRSLADVRVAAGLPLRYELVSVSEFIAEVMVTASLEARARECYLSVGFVDPELAVDADRDMLFSALSNLLQNAFKFTKHNTEVTLDAYASADRVIIEVKDHCGGLPPGAEESMFAAFSQSGADRSGLGLGLSICRRSVEANNGTVVARDVPGTGCVFTINLPRHAMDDPQPSA